MNNKMRGSFPSIVGFCSGLASLWLSAPALGATASAAVLKAKQDAEARGYIFEASRDEIIAKAKKEGRLLALSSLEAPTIKAVADGFRAEYPFLNVHGEEVFAGGFAQEQATRGRKLSVVDWNHFAKMPEYQSKVIEAYGFRKAERK